MTETRAIIGICPDPQVTRMPLVKFSGPHLGRYL